MVKTKEKVEFLRTASILFGEDRLGNIPNNLRYVEDDFYEGNYCYGLAIEYKEEAVLNEETEACYATLDFFENRVPVKVEFEDRAFSFYDWKTDSIKLSPRVKKMQRFVSKLSLKDIILVTYLREYGYRSVYNGGDYENLLNMTINQYNGKARQNNNTGEVVSVTRVPQNTWDCLLRAEFRVEQLAWNYVFEVLETAGYSIEGESVIDKEDLRRIKNYFLYKKLCQLHKARERQELKFLGAHTFKY